MTAGATLPDRCLSLDLEVDPSSGRILALAAVRRDRPGGLVARGAQVAAALDALPGLAGGADFILGHNIRRFDLPQLLARRPALAALAPRLIDTLWLNPLAFPQNPYHHLVKHHHDGRLVAGHVNDPERDARLVFEVFANQLQAFAALAGAAPDALTAWHYLCTRLPGTAGFDAVLAQARAAPCPAAPEAQDAVRRLLDGRACTLRRDQTIDRLAAPGNGWPMAYALAWISVAGGNSVMPPWVRAQFREAALIVRHLRDTACTRPDCAWCRGGTDPLAALKRWFGFDAFRPEPADALGRPVQENIVAEALAGASVLGILPTGTGKSVCYQVPALTRHDRTGALTVVLSPLVALMADQVAGLARQGIASAVTVNGTLSLPERQAALDRVRLGDAAILLISPEQLRSVSVRAVLAQREIGLWVMDEAHCLSKWGHDFRPDYRYVARFIRETQRERPPVPVLCLTATAKPEVVEDIRSHFRDRLGLDLVLHDGGALRSNLSFQVLPSRNGAKMAQVLDAIERALPAQGVSGAIVYCATRAAAEAVAAQLQSRGMAAAHFHAGVPPETRRDVQARFQVGDLRVIAATNAFGMGIDKPDIRLVVHHDIPGSLENYLQEAGRAGRDRAGATCVLLYAADDIERQFDLSARSRLERHEIGAILKAVRRLDGRGGPGRGEVVATPGEILREDRDRDFERDSQTDDTRVKTAVAWLEEARLVNREENRVQVFPSSLRIRTMAEAEARLAAAEITQTRKGQLLAIVRHLMNAPPDKGISTDELAGLSGLTGAALRGALTDLETLGIATDDTAITVAVHAGVAGSSLGRFRETSDQEATLIALMRELAPDLGPGETSHLHLAAACQRLHDLGHGAIRPDLVETHLRALAEDGRDLDGGGGNLRLRKLRRGLIEVALLRPWATLAQTADLRRRAAESLLRFLLARLPRNARGNDLPVETTMGALLAQVTGDMLVRSATAEPARLMQRALMWLHEQGAVRLGRGLAIFRPAITLHLHPGGLPFTQADYQPLAEHYEAQTAQIHIMARYAEQALASQSLAEDLARDYFTMENGGFLRKWLPDGAADIRRQTTPEAWRAIVEDLENPVQQRIVADEREQTSVLVLAGPGAGKTRVLVHRIAWLVRVRRADPAGILVLTYNRHAAAEVRRRLAALIGPQAGLVTVSTCHALAMRLVGATFAGTFERGEEPDFEGVLRDAAALLRGDGLPRAEAEARREALIEGYRWILVDEYQDIGPGEYALIAAVAGRSLEDPDLRLSLFAVGDDDQNIYAFNGSSVEYIRRFEADYAARAVYLTENYRSTAAIIAAANRVIAPAAGRMKADRPITIDRARRQQPEGGPLAGLDPVARGRVQVLRAGPGEAAQAWAAVAELVRLSQLVPGWSWSRAAVIAREWAMLHPVRALCEARGIPVQMARETLPAPWRLREVQVLLAHLRAAPGGMVTVPDVQALVARQGGGRWWDWLAEGVAALDPDGEGRPLPVAEAIEALVEWMRERRSAQQGLLLLSAHRAKGLEFDDVVILDGGWDRPARGEDADAKRRLFYVAMTRARRSLTLTQAGAVHPLVPSDGLLLRQAPPDAGALRAAALTWQSPDLRMVDLSFPGRLVDGAPALALIAGLRPGDPLLLHGWQGRWFLRHPSGHTIGRMAASYAPPPGLAFVRGEVAAVLGWHRGDNAEEFRSALRRESWEVVLPELVFGPGEA